MLLGSQDVTPQMNDPSVVPGGYDPLEDERYRRTPIRPKPIMIPVDQPPPPRERKYPISEAPGALSLSDGFCFSCSYCYCRAQRPPDRRRWPHPHPPHLPTHSVQPAAVLQHPQGQCQRPFSAKLRWAPPCFLPLSLTRTSLPTLLLLRGSALCSLSLHCLTLRLSFCLWTMLTEDQFNSSTLERRKSKDRLKTGSNPRITGAIGRTL